jgi:hypothetical protein
MWTRVSSPAVPQEDRELFIVTPHHPDRLRRPAVHPGTASECRFQHALLWNTFRTLELIAPWFWLRRFHLRLTGHATLVPPQILRVHLWHPLPLPPIQRIDGGRSALTADVVIETEHAVWTLAAEPTVCLADGETAAAMVDAGSWFAGVRQLHCGVLESSESTAALGSVLRARYSRSRDSARLQSSAPTASTTSPVTWGSIGSRHLMALLHECSESGHLSRVERALALNALDWLASVGVNGSTEAISDR